MKWKQLELFPGTEQQPAATVDKLIKRADTVIRETPINSTVPFPADRQFAYVIKIARALDGRDERLAAKYWRTECNRLTARLQVQGFDAATIRAEIVRFGNAVARHRANNDRQRPTGGAA